MSGIRTRELFAPVILSICVGFISQGCAKRAHEEATVIASVGEEKITLEDYNERLSNMPERYREVIGKRKKEFIEDWVNDTLLYREAVKMGLDRNEDVRDVIEQARKKILIARLLKDEVDDRIEIEDADVQAFYSDNRDKYMTPEVMRVSHILVPSPGEASAILEEIRSGASFEDMARAKSVDPTAQRAGDIGYFPRGQLMPEFENACSELEPGQISGVVKTKLGYHIIKLTDRRPPRQRPVEDVRDDIVSRLRTLKRQKIFNELLARLREETEIVIHEEKISSEHTTRAGADPR